MFVSLVGAIVLLLGLLGIAIPSRMASLVPRWRVLTLWWAAIATRLAVGVLFVFAAPYCRLPGVVRVAGVFAAIAAVGVLAAGRARFDRVVSWWLHRPPWVIRVWCVFACAVGALLVWAGAWPW